MCWGGDEKPKKEKGENSPLTKNQFLPAFAWLLRDSWPGLIAFHYKFSPQPIRDRPVAVRPAGPPTHTLISSLVTDTHLMTGREHIQ